MLLTASGFQDFQLRKVMRYGRKLENWTLCLQFFWIAMKLGTDIHDPLRMNDCIYVVLFWFYKTQVSIH